MLRYQYNCSGTTLAKAVWSNISNADTPTEAMCQDMRKECDGKVGAHGSAVHNQTCDDDCYSYCWKKDVGDCADMDDEQIFCVAQCMQYCVNTNCYKTKPSWSTCQATCNTKHMQVSSVNF